MTLQNLAKIGQLKPHVAEPAEVQRLLAAIERDLADAGVTGIHDETRFDCAYKAIMQCALVALLANGYLHLELYPFEPFADRIWELRHSVTSYDAWYVAVAEALGLPLATLDTRLAKARGPACNFLTPPS